MSTNLGQSLNDGSTLNFRINYERLALAEAILIEKVQASIFLLTARECIIVGGY